MADVLATTYVANVIFDAEFDIDPLKPCCFVVFFSTFFFFSSFCFKGGREIILIVLMKFGLMNIETIDAHMQPM